MTTELPSPTLPVLVGPDTRPVPYRPARPLDPPAIVAQAGAAAAERYIEFFTAQIRNPHTRRAYAQAVARFLNWCEDRNARLQDIRPVVVAAYIEQMTRERGPQTVKQHLAAIRVFFDWMVTGQIVPVNPAASVRGPRSSIEEGKTPVLTNDEARKLLDAIDTSHVVGLRDRAMLAVMVYSFARVGAVVKMKVADYYGAGKRWQIRLNEKGGKFRKIPVHHTAEEYLDAYLDSAGIREDAKGYLFRTTRGHTKKLTDRPLYTRDMLRMVKRRAKDAGLSPEVCCHTFRATGITEYMRNGGDIKKAAKIAGHRSTRTTSLYDRSGADISLDEIERILI
jgi:integrase/recombinase XerD